MLINTFLDTEDFVHLYYPEDEPVAAAQGCGAGARMASKYPPRPPSPDYSQVATPSTSEMSDRERYRAPPQPEPPPHRVRAADLYPRLRTHYDEPGLDVPFSPICGEFVQWVGRMADGGVIAMSNYRVHAQPRRRGGPGASVPVRLVDALEIRDLLHLIVLCKNGRTLKCSFTSGEQCVEWWRRLSTAMAPMTSVQDTFAAAYAAWAKEQPASSVHRALLRESHAAHTHWFGPEVERLGFTAKGAWRVTTANEKYELCPSYPPLLVVPASICDEDLDSVARFRAMRRIPAAVWRHRGNGAVIARSSQPEVGWLGWRSAEDERLLAAFVTACNADRPPTNKQVKLLIVDARSYASAVTNRARGGGCECQQYYPLADIQFMSMPNIHHVRRSFHHMRALAADAPDQPNWHSNLERTLWLQSVSGIARAAGVVCRAVAAARPVLVHCSDGWDRTPQIVAAAQLLLDPHYRTLQGFRILIEREWLDFGHKFADRCGHQFGPEDPNERSPIFLQWLDWVHQVALQHPCSFEFNEAYLLKLATHVHSCMFGTFLCNTRRERAAARVAEHAAHVWRLLDAPVYRNHLYEPHHDQVLWAEFSVRSAAVWARLFAAPRDQHHDEPRRDHDLAHTPPAGLMTKTRSCDNLLNDGEKRTAVRRCSDPSIAPDVMKLSLVVKETERRECRALTDSCVDELPALPTPHDQVDGLHPDHFDSRAPRDLASGSSSLERELCPPPLVDISTPIDMSKRPGDLSPVTVDLATMSVDLATMPVQMPVDTMPLVELNTRLMPVNGVRAADMETPEEPPVFVCDTYTDVIGMAEAAREVGRTRNISITWRSISESSNQSSTGFDIADTPNRLDNSLPNSAVNSLPNSVVNSLPNSAVNSLPNSVVNSLPNSAVNSLPNSVVNSAVNSMPNSRVNSMPNSRVNSHESSPLSNHDSTEGDVVNHNGDELNGRVNGVVNGLDDVAAKFLEVDLNGGEAATSSSVSSESECETRSRRVHAARGSQATLCPASPRACRCEWCACGAARARCVCGGGGAPADPLDGLPPDTDPLQARLHQIILYQRKVVEELSGQLREAREALRLSSPPAASPAARAVPDTAHHAQKSSSSAGSGSGSSSASEVEVGEEARGVVWLPDSAAPRCQHCHHHFWLARRRHHCRRCGGIFCGSCSEMSEWGSCGAVRVCRPCRALR